MRKRFALMTFAAWDVASVYLSYNATYQARLGKWEGWSAGLAVISATWLAVSYLVGRYSPPSDINREHIGLQLAKTTVAGVAVVAVFIGHSWIYQVVGAETRFRGFLIPAALGMCILSSLGELLKTGAAKRRRKWWLLGNSAEMMTIIKELKSEGSSLHAETYIASAEETSSLLQGQSEQEVGLAVGSVDDNSEKENEYLLKLREKGHCVIPLLNWCEQELQRIPPELVHSEWLIQAEGFALRPGSFSWRVKRFGDVAGAVVLAALTAPLLIVGGACVWLTDRGPVFYRQTRSGLYGRPITIWKLRSMRVNAEQRGAQWATRGDTRITRVGRLIRAMRIDELPQLFSVISGDLSLIGPRPERPEIEDSLEHSIPNYRIRHWIRPGLSGWAQVCYPYGASTEDSRMKLSYDLYYLRNASIAMDVLITIKTIRLVTGGQGASPRS